MFDRHRFKTTADDYRPVQFPPPGPYWCTGYSNLSISPVDGDDSNARAVIVAILPKGEDLMRWWPDAEHVETTEVDAITFTDRFPRPSWWEPELKSVPP